MISAPPEEDSALVAAVLRKDRKATAEFVARYADDVYRYLRSRLAPVYDQVEDLVHEVFLAAWESLPGYQGSGPLRAWVMGIARHKVEDSVVAGDGRPIVRERLDSPLSGRRTAIDDWGPDDSFPALSN
jgi:RNA polymerase sigma-70 factor (ECF subfamily)